MAVADLKLLSNHLSPDACEAFASHFGVYPTPRITMNPGLVAFLRASFRRVLAIVCFAFGVHSPLGAAVLRESFNYPDGTVLVNSDVRHEPGLGGWRRHDGTGNGNGTWIKVNQGAVSLSAVNGQDIYLPLGTNGTINYPAPVANSSPGPIYFAFDLKISAATAAGDLFFGIASSSTNVRTGIRAKSSGAGYVFGYGGTNITYETTERSFGTTYRVILRYNVLAGSANNPGTLYVFPSDLAGVDLVTESNNTPVISGYVAGTDWDTGIPGPLLNQSVNSPVVTSLAKLVISDNFADATGTTAATPAVGTAVFSPTAGTYPVAQLVAIASNTAGASIRYTTDDSNPSTTIGTLYTGPVEVGSALTLKAIAYKEGMLASVISSAGYVIGSPPVVTPTFSPAAGNYTTAQSVTISTVTSGATIRYTTDGSNPTSTTGTVYSGPVSVASSTTIRAIAFKSGSPDSAVAAAAYSIGAVPVSAPTFNPAGGTYATTQSVIINSSTSGASIRYTIDGSNPTSTTGMIYSGPISIASTTTVRAIAYKEAATDSAVTSATYVIDTTPVAAPVFSIPGGPYAGPQRITMTSATSGAAIRFTTDGSDPTPTTGTVYSGSILLVSAKTLKAVAYRTGMVNSVVTSANYSISAPALATYGPNGTHWPANTPKPGSAAISKVVDVACTWAAIGEAISAATPAEIESGLHIRIAPGTLPGNGSSSGSTPVLQNIDKSGYSKNILVSPRDGWGSVTITAPARLLAIQGVTFARINGNHTLLTNCSNTSWAQSLMTYGFRITASFSATVTNCNVYEVVMRDAKADINDPLGYAAGDNCTLTNSTWEGIYCAPVFRPDGTTDHVDTIQMYGNGFYRGLTIRDSILWGSKNCALQLGGSPATDPLRGTPFATIERTILTSQNMAIQGRYALPENAEPPLPGLGQAINGAGEDWQLYASDSIMFGTLYTSKWASVSNSIASYELSPTNNPAVAGGWVFDANLSNWTPADFDAVAPVPTDEYLAVIWADPEPVSATVTIADLQQPYTGEARSVSVATSPAGLPVQVTYNGSATPPVNAGTYAVTATITDADYFGSASATFVIEPATATVTLGGLDHVYDGSGKSATVTTAPSGVAINLTYEGNTALPVNAGSYAVLATLADSNYAGAPASGTLTIAPAYATISVGGLSQVYNGAPRIVSATTIPSGLGVQVTYNGSASAPTNAGNYAVAVTLVDANYIGSAAGTLTVARAAATVTLSNLFQAYDGTPRTVVGETTPPDLALNVTYDGAATAPTNPGSYAVVVSINDFNYSGSASGTLFIGVTALVRHLESLNGGIDGSVQVVTPENVTLNGSAWISGDLLVPGTPTIRLNGQPHYGSTIDGSGAPAPTNHTITLNGNAVLRHVVRRTNAVALPVVVAPPTPTGTRNVSLNNPGQSAGDFATLRNLTLNGNAGQVVVPPGTYGSFTANGSSSFVFGVAGATNFSVYNLQNLTLNGTSRITIAGPVIINLASGTSLNGSVGEPGNPEWLQLNVASGGLTLNGNVTFDGYITAPSGTVTINGNSTLNGGIVADRLVINGSGALVEGLY